MTDPISRARTGPGSPAVDGPPTAAFGPGDLRDALQAAHARIAELEPAATAWTALAGSAGDYSLRDAAQILDRDPAISTGQNRLARDLRRLGWTDLGGMPYQRVVDQGYLRSRLRSSRHPRTGVPVPREPQVRITPKGLARLHQVLGGTGGPG